jgi:hypothetical protein
MIHNCYQTLPQKIVFGMGVGYLVTGIALFLMVATGLAVGLMGTAILGYSVIFLFVFLYSLAGAYGLQTTNKYNYGLLLLGIGIYVGFRLASGQITVIFIPISVASMVSLLIYSIR